YRIPTPYARNREFPRVAPHSVALVARDSPPVLHRDEPAAQSPASAGAGEVDVTRAPSGCHPSAPRFPANSVSSCPDPGRKLRKDSETPMVVDVPEQTLVDHVVATTGLTPAEATRVIDDVVAFHTETVEELVRRRHAQLKTYGAKNDE